MSSPKQSKSGLGHLLMVGGGNSPRFVPPVLREVGKLAAGVASVSTTGSATGNPRNKCILKPGHSHIDWVRLSNSKDLTGLGERAGKLEVTLEELAKHNKISDGWLAINGKVFNVTSYFPFHPGGVEELKKGLGIDATKLFYEVHNWVNCDTLLKSCYVGRLLTSPQKETKESNLQSNSNHPSPRKETEESTDVQPGQSKVSIPINIVKDKVDDAFPKGLLEESLEVHSFRSTHEDPDMELTTSNFYNKYYKPAVQVKGMPKFEWIQKLNVVTISFNITRFSNPLVEAKMVGKACHVIMSYDDKTVVNEVMFDEDVLWPCAIKSIEEDGKVELTFKKAKDMLWNNYGFLKQTVKMGYFSEDRRIDYVVKSKKEIAKDIFLMELHRKDGVVISVPISHHLRVFSGPGDQDTSKSYTPIPSPKSLFPIPANATWGGYSIYLMVKRYETGTVSKYICDADEGTVLQMSRPISPGFRLVKLHDKDRFICLAAGTGLTPMLSLMLSILQRRSRKCKRFATLFCNSKKEHIPFLEEYSQLLETERCRKNRIYVRHIVTDLEFPNEPLFCEGHITIEHIRDAIEDIYKPGKGIEDDLFVFVCGPRTFNEICKRYLSELKVPEDQIFVFQE